MCEAKAKRSAKATSKSLFREGTTGRGLQIMLKRTGQYFIRKRYRCLDSPRSELGGVQHFAGVVFC